MTWLLRAVGGLKSAGLWILGILVAAAGLFLAGRKSGKDSLRADQAEESAERVREAHENRDEIRRLTDPELDERLRRFQRRH